MNIAMVAPYDLNQTGGVEKYVLSFCEMAARNTKLVLFTDTVFESGNYQIRSLVSVKTDPQVYDICITHAIHGYSFLPRARRYMHIFHGTILGNLYARPWLVIHPSFLKWLLMEKRSMSQKNGIIGVSHQACDEIKRMGFQGQLRRIPSGGGSESHRYEDGLKSETLTIVFCGRTRDKVKRFQWILEGFILARKKYPEIELRVLGPGCEGIAIQGVHFLGKLEAHEVHKEFSKAHIQLNASYYEGSSLALAEGVLLGGLVSLVTPVGGNQDIIEHGSTGYFFKTPHELASYLCKLAENQKLLKNLLANVQRQKFQWTWEKVVSDVLDFGLDLLNEGS